MFSYPSEPLLHKNQHDIHNNFIIQMSGKNINTTTAAVDVSTASNVQLVEKGKIKSYNLICASKAFIFYTKLL